MSKILIGMSGGVDSTASALRLKNEGHEVIGVHMKLWNECLDTRSGACCTPEDVLNLKLISNEFGFPFYTLTLHNEFYNDIVLNYINAYKNGNTFIPCSHCNTLYKWGKLWEMAKKFNCDYVATGHYAIKEKVFDKWVLKVSESDDQSHFLWGLTQDQLEVAMFPIGNIQKDVIRDELKNSGIKSWNKAKSMDLCFISDSSKEFLKRHIPEAFIKGRILNNSGECIGIHNGYGGYSISQRILISGMPCKYYVISIDIKENIIYAGPIEETLTDEFRISGENWFIEPMKIGLCKFRHAGKLYEYRLMGNKVVINERIPNIPPGQSVVFYSMDGKYCLGGAWISC